MSKIPEDIYAVALTVMRALSSPSHQVRCEAIACALMEERERCARIVETWGEDDKCIQPMFPPLAAAIRTPSTGEEQ